VLGDVGEEVRAVRLELLDAQRDRPHAVPPDADPEGGE